jgi:hypothetical protein
VKTAVVGGALVWCVAFGALAAGCGDDPARQDLNPNSVEQNREERLVYVMPDQFPNVIAFCDGNTRIYITTREDQAPVLVADSPECQG